MGMYRQLSSSASCVPPRKSKNCSSLTSMSMTGSGGSGLANRGDRHPGQLADSFFDTFPANIPSGTLVELVFLKQLLQVVALFGFFVGIKAGFFKFVIRDGSFHSLNDEADARLDGNHFLRQRPLLELGCCPGLVDDINGRAGHASLRT